VDVIKAVVSVGVSRRPEKDEVMVTHRVSECFDVRRRIAVRYTSGNHVVLNRLWLNAETASA